MGYRRLGAILVGPTRVAVWGAEGREALSRAYALRARLSDRERYHIEGIYADAVEQDFEKAVTAYLALLEKYPNDGVALNNLGRAYQLL
ncbi:MAG: hypothetical protein HYV20_17640, partial [Gemmatimonadetes bacterium]|nr:hypothetical protein [Gemmatimonadota bacterium]